MALLTSCWENEELTQAVYAKGEMIQESMNMIVAKYPKFDIKVRCRGMIWGFSMPSSGLARALSQEAFNKSFDLLKFVAVRGRF